MLSELTRESCAALLTARNGEGTEMTQCAINKMDQFDSTVGALLLGYSVDFPSRTIRFYKESGGPDVSVVFTRLCFDPKHCVVTSSLGSTTLTASGFFTYEDIAAAILAFRGLLV